MWGRDGARRGLPRQTLLREFAVVGKNASSFVMPAKAGTQGNPIVPSAPTHIADTADAVSEPAQAGPLAAPRLWGHRSFYAENIKPRTAKRRGNHSE